MTKAHCKQTLLLAVGIVAVLVGCGDQGGLDESASPGQAAFARHCGGCHGMQGQGRPPAFPPLSGSEWLSFGPEGLTVIVLLGLRGDIEVAGQSYAGYMPPMQHIDDSRIAAIVRHVKQRWSQPAPEFSGEDVARLRSALAGRETPDGRAGLERLLEELP